MTAPLKTVYDPLGSPKNAEEPQRGGRVVRGSVARPLQASGRGLAHAPRARGWSASVVTITLPDLWVPVRRGDAPGCLRRGRPWHQGSLDGSNWRTAISSARPPGTGNRLTGHVRTTQKHGRRAVVL